MAAAEPSSSAVSAETLTNTLSLSSENRVYSEGRTEAGYISLFSWREVFVWLPAGLGKSICFQMIPFLLQAAHLAGIHKLKKTTTESCTQCSRDVTV